MGPTLHREAFRCGLRFLFLLVTFRCLCLVEGEVHTSRKHYIAKHPATPCVPSVGHECDDKDDISDRYLRRGKNFLLLPRTVS